MGLAVLTETIDGFQGHPPRTGPRLTLLGRFRKRGGDFRRHPAPAGEDALRPRRISRRKVAFRTTSPGGRSANARHPGARRGGIPLGGQRDAETLVVPRRGFPETHRSRSSADAAPEGGRRLWIPRPRRRRQSLSDARLADSLRGDAASRAIRAHVPFPSGHTFFHLAKRTHAGHGGTFGHTYGHRRKPQTHKHARTRQNYNHRQCPQKRTRSKEKHTQRRTHVFRACQREQRTEIAS